MIQTSTKERKRNKKIIKGTNKHGKFSLENFAEGLYNSYVGFNGNLMGKKSFNSVIYFTQVGTLMIR